MRGSEPHGAKTASLPPPMAKWAEGLCEGSENSVWGHRVRAPASLRALSTWSSPTLDPHKYRQRLSTQLRVLGVRRDRHNQEWRSLRGPSCLEHSVPGLPCPRRVPSGPGLQGRGSVGAGGDIARVLFPLPAPGLTPVTGKVCRTALAWAWLPRSQPQRTLHPSLRLHGSILCLVGG